MALPIGTGLALWKLNLDSPALATDRDVRWELRIVFLISYRKKFDGTKLQTNLRKTFFAEHPDHPSTDEIEQLVDSVSQGEFGKSSIQLQRCIGFDAADLSKSGVTVYRFRAASTELTS